MFDQDDYSRRRKRWMQTYGVSRSIDLGHMIMDDYHEPLKPMKISGEYGDSYEARLQQYSGRVDRALGTMGGLGVLTSMIGLQLEREIPAHLSEQYGIEHCDYFVFRNGLADQGFTWDFAPFVASRVLRCATRDGVVPTDSLVQASLCDWADIFRKDWFSDFMHDLAFASNGIYARLGAEFWDYLDPDDTHLTHDHAALGINQPLNISVLATVHAEHGDILPEIQATLSPELRKYLRNSMKRMNSNGCPVARHHFVSDNPDGDPHLQRLLDVGLVKEVGMGHSVLRLVQEQTPIDRMLQLLAEKFEYYEEHFGTPVLDFSGFRHEDRSQTHPLLITVEDEL